MTTPPPPDAARAAFETEFGPLGYILSRDGERYSYPMVMMAWLGFRAAYRLMAKDAERYLFLRDSDWNINEPGLSMQDWDDGELDAAVDAAMSAVKGEKG